MQTKLHYIYDPLCGWCYAAESLLEAAMASGSRLYELELHAGGLFQRMHIPADKRDMIRQSDARIAQNDRPGFWPGLSERTVGQPAHHF